MNDALSPYRPLRGSAYRKQHRQGHLYEAPVFYTQARLIVARPLYDTGAPTGSESLPANILLQPDDLFEHTPFPQLRLGADEEFRSCGKLGEVWYSCPYTLGSGERCDDTVSDF